MTPTCPKCGCPMTGGAPHGPWTIQWECRPCNVFITGRAPAVEMRFVPGVGFAVLPRASKGGAS